MTIMASICSYYSAKLWPMNSISCLWLPWGLPYPSTKPSACPTQGSKDIDNNSHTGCRSSQSSGHKNRHICCTELKTPCSSVASNKLNVGIVESVALDKCEKQHLSSAWVREAHDVGFLHNRTLVLQWTNSPWGLSTSAWCRNRQKLNCLI